MTLEIAFSRYAPQLAKRGSGRWNSIIVPLTVCRNTPTLLRKTSRTIQINIGIDLKKIPIPTFFIEYLSSSVFLPAPLRYLLTTPIPWWFCGNLTPFLLSFPLGLSWWLSIFPEFLQPLYRTFIFVVAANPAPPSTSSLHLSISSSLCPFVISTCSTSSVTCTCFCPSLSLSRPRLLGR